MYRIRLHGRGGQGMKTASRILGSALFREGFEVQDAPRYGAERRGAPIFAYVRADRRPVRERGIIRRPDLVLVADETLVPVNAAGVLDGVGARTVLLINSAEAPGVWGERLKVAGPVLTLPVAAEERAELPFLGAVCAAAAARLLGVVSRGALEAAIAEELADLPPAVVAENRERGLAAFDALAEREGCVEEGGGVSASGYERPDWIDVPFDPARVSAPDIHARASSVQVRTGLWRTLRPVVDYERCRGCSWMCSTFCPDSAIAVAEDRSPRIDLDHCKGCMICVAVCPTHAIEAIAEREAARADGAAADCEEEAGP
ncbi:MAG: 2-oxoacid:acceptor oxidoreductase family protein [Deltaproteobacteria bacterium]|nr:2-oxoacid:acceptor oxidoreductase family protein [Deltaproteobacteria bacterium]MBW2420271.1 2-oxoacid:acceptor oxidoreductase family protein [Deltaproteobacteria bacterium]